MKKVLIKFWHGLGDAVQLTLVLQHIAKHRRDWVVDVTSKVGKHSCFHGLCHRSFTEGEAPPDHLYDAVYDLGWFENYNGYSDRQQTKVTNSLAEELGIDFDPSIIGYKINVTEHQRRRAREYFDSITKDKFVDLTKVGGRAFVKSRIVLIHYEGNTSPLKKNLHPNHVAAVIHTVVERGFKVVLLDWDHRSGFPDDKNVFCPRADHPLWDSIGTGDASMIKTMVDESALFIGIDSGPGHVAGASDRTDSVIVWRGHHPFQFYDPCKRVMHLIPDHQCGYFDSRCGRDVFEREYKFKTYSTKYRESIGMELANIVRQKLRIESMIEEDGLVPYRAMKIRAKMFDQDQEIVEDVMFNDSYQLRHYPAKDWKFVVDVGAQVGSFAKLIYSINPSCRIVCVEPSPDNLAVLRQNVGHFAEIVPAAMVGFDEDNGQIEFSEPDGDDRASTGGGSIKNEHWAGKEREPQKKYLVDTVCLRDVAKGQRIDCLKLDCEGAEYLIIEPYEVRDVGLIAGEWHGSFEKFQKFRRETVPDFDFGDMSRHDDSSTNGVFHLIPRYK